MKDRVQELASLLRQQATAMLASYPAIRHTWLDQGAIVTLAFPPLDESGFEIAVQVGNGYVYVLVGQSHYRFDLHSRPPEPEIAKALGLVRDLLSNRMRLRESRSNDKPYRWIVEREVSGQWEPELIEENPFFNYFGRRSERLYYNNQVPRS
jgi:hypothetical protein